MRTVKKTISPQVAEVLLKENKGNRKLNDKHVNFLASQIKAGKWKSTGDTIKISSNGRILDGQHRLNAIIKANKSIDTLVCYELEDDIFDVIDTGRNRTAGTVLSLLFTLIRK